MILAMAILRIFPEACDKVLRDKAFNIAKNKKCDGYQRELASLVYNFFDKKSASDGVVKDENMSN